MGRMFASARPFAGMPLASQTVSVKALKPETVDFLGIIQNEVLFGEKGEILYNKDEDVVGLYLGMRDAPLAPIHPYFDDVTEVWLVTRPGAEGNPPENYRANPTPTFPFQKDPNSV